MQSKELRGTARGRGVRQGYWYPQASDNSVTITLGCEQNQEFWANIVLTEGELNALLQEIKNARDDDASL